MKEIPDLPNPGSSAACILGCTCPILDNNGGEGLRLKPGSPPVFWMNEDCPLHGKGDLKDAN